MSEIEQQLTAERDLAIRERDAVRKALEQQIDNAKRDLAAVQRGHAEEIHALRREVFIEQQDRIAAQRGLVPYVRSLEAFHGWLLKHPDLAAQVEAEMRDLGIWAIKLGYDPDKDLSLSVVWAKRS